MFWQQFPKFCLDIIFELLDVGPDPQWISTNTKTFMNATGFLGGGQGPKNIGQPYFMAELQSKDPV